MTDLATAPRCSTSLPDVRGSQSVTAQGSGKNRAFELSLLSLYAVLLALVTARHAMWRDELEAWLIARDSNSLADIFHNLRYEGHPGLWYLILYIPAHISWNPISMQVINDAIAVAAAWLILSARKVHWAFRVLTIFSFFFFYQYGVVARSYMLATVLLIAAVRCLTGERQHRKLAVVFFALAINVHFFAVPIAGVFALQLLPVERLKSWSDVGKLLRERGFQAACITLLGSVLIAYFTIRPPADAYKHLGLEEHSVAYNLLSTESRTWQAFIPPNHVTARVSWLGLHWSGSNLYSFGPPAGFSLALFLLLATALRTARARSLFLIAAALEVVAMSLTYRPALWHFGLIFTAFILALLIDAYAVTNRNPRPWLPQSAAFAVILAILGPQTWSAARASMSEWVFPYSNGKKTSSWLKQAGFDKNPLVVMPDTYGATLLGYLQRPSAYYPVCRCVGSFAVRKEGWDSYHLASEDELEDLAASAHLPVVVVSGWELPPETLQRLHLKELSAFSGPSQMWESFYVYQWSGS
jgi:hypothetical protein